MIDNEQGMSQDEILTDDRGVRYVEDFDGPLPEGWASCGTCHRAWDDTVSTSVTPAPSARCPFEYDHERDIWALLEESAPDGCDAVQDLYSWSLNYRAGKGPFALFLDLIGWSADELGEPIYSLADASLGYLELDKLSEALSEYVSHPQDVRSYVDTLMAAEAQS